MAALLVIPFWLGGADPFNDFYVPVTTPGIYGILALQILTAVAVMAFFAKNRRGVGSLRTIVAPGLGALGMAIVLYFAVENVGLITGRTGTLNAVLVGSTIVVFAVGFIIALIIKKSRPEVYAKFATDPA